ncbi:MAG: hypothetical protein EAZ61_04800 [Oscillatoriales cyanobacterium]|nr:MAG: hypothetical protein EAZ61_04800 [Oscillatoriales cyanobacterium]
MSDLKYTERQQLETILEMESGYVLDFYNHTFREFILDSIKIDIYDSSYVDIGSSSYKYPSGSKANLLRFIWDKEENDVVASLLSDLLDYWLMRKLQEKNSLDQKSERLHDFCQRIVLRLKSTKPEVDEASQISRFDVLKRFDSLQVAKSSLDKRKRGLELEKILQDAFHLHSIKTHKPFHRNSGGEQIDGAFEFEGWFYLVECKWTEKLSDIRQLDSLSGKLSRSARQTMGLFLSINGWSSHVLNLLKQNPDKSIILMDGFDLRCVLDNQKQISLRELLSRKISALNLNSEPFYSVSNLNDEV